MATLFDENRFEDEIDSKIKSVVKSEIPRRSSYGATAVRKDSEGTWWVRLDGNDFETPVMVNTVDMSPGDRVVVTIFSSNHVTKTEGNITSPPMSAANAATYIDSVVADSIYAQNAKFGYLEADIAQIGHAQIEDADITNARIQNLTVEVTALEGNYNTLAVNALTANSAVITDLQAQTAKVESLTAEDLTATVGYIESLTAGDIEASDIVSDHATIGTLDSTYATINELHSDYITSNVIEANYTKTDFSNAGVAWIENGTIANAAITNEMVNSVSANKLTAGTIDASKINVTNLNADNLIVRRINGQPVFGGYTLISSTSPGYSSKNPASLGWYEFSNGSFVLTSDTSPQEGKAYYQEGDEVLVYDQDYIDGIAEQLNQRIDGAVEVYSGTAIPTLNNYPYNTWYDNSTTPITDNRAEHVGNIYYVVDNSFYAVNKQSSGYSSKNPTAEDWYELVNGEYVHTTDTAVVSSKTYYEPNRANGYCYRFAYDSTSYQYMWILIKDSDVTAALADISDLQSFQTSTSHWIDETDEGLTSIRNQYTTLSGIVETTVVKVDQLWYAKSNSTAPNPPQAQVTVNSTSSYNQWNLAVPAYSSTYPHYFYCWQYKYSNNTYGWSTVVYDQDALATAKGKRRVFTTTPTPPYDVGDLWVNGDEIKYATVAKASGQSYSSTDWSQTATDDTAANAAQATADDNIKTSVQLWYTSNSETPPTKPTNTNQVYNDTSSGHWTTKVPAYSSTTPNYHYCYQQQKGDNSYYWTDPVYDGATSIAMMKAQNVDNIFTTFEQTHNKTLVDTVDESSSTITTLSESFKGGAENLLDDTTNMGDSWNKGSSTTVVDGVATLVGSSSNWNAVLNTNKFDAALYDGTTKYTLAFDYKSTAACTLIVYMAGTAQSVDSDLWTRTKYGQWQSSVSLPSTGGQWVRYVLTPRAIALSDLNNGSGSVVSGYLQLFARSNTTLYIRRIKLEAGEIATVWKESSTQLSNTVNTVKQTSDSNYATISNLTTTLGTNADGTTADEDIVHKTSAVEHTLDGLSSRVATTEGRLIGQYALCGTAATTSAKVATIEPEYSGTWPLSEGTVVTVLFQYANTASSPTLNVNASGAKQIRNTDGEALTTAEKQWAAGSAIMFSYDGTYWRADFRTLYLTVRSSESLIKQTASNVLIKATEDDTTAAQGGQHLIQSLINVAPSGVTIDASKVEIDGPAIFSAISSDVDSAISEGTENLALKTDAVKRTQRIWYRKAASGAPATPGTSSSSWVTNGNSVSGWTKYNVWSTRVPPIADSVAASATKYPYLYTCEQREMGNGNLYYTTVLVDDSTTVIDGGRVITGSVTANQVDFADASGNQLKLFDPSAPTNYQTISSSGSEIYQGGPNSVAKFGADGARIGDVESTHMSLEQDGLRLYKGEDTLYADSSVAKFTVDGSTIGDVRDIHTETTAGGFRLLNGEDALFAVSADYAMTEHSQNPAWTVKKQVFDEDYGSGTVDSSTRGYIRANGDVYDDSGAGDDGWCYVMASVDRARPQVFLDLADQTDDVEREWVPIEELVAMECATYEYLDEQYADEYRFWFKVVVNSDYWPVRWKVGIAHYERDIEARIGKLDAAHSSIDANGQRFYAADGSTELANIGYGSGTSYDSSSTSTKPYYTFGQRKGNSSIGNYSIAEGYLTQASGYAAHAEGSGQRVLKSGVWSWTDGPMAMGYASHAEGVDTAASGWASHAEGTDAVADGNNSHATGAHTIAIGDESYAGGAYTTVTGSWSHAEGYATTSSYDYQFVIGQYNDNKSTNVFEIGNGSSTSQSNAFEVGANGNATASGTITAANVHEILTARVSTALSLSTTAQKVTLSQNAKVGSNLSISSGGIKCAKAGTVLVSGQCYMQDVNDTNVCNAYIYKNSTVWTQSTTRASGQRTFVALAEHLITVAAGDTIYLYASNTTTAAGSVAVTTSATTYLTVRYV